MDQLRFDENVALQLEAMYRTRDVQRRRRLVREALGALPGERILDVGCGPGFFAVELLEEVGPEGSVVGVDSSAQMLALAARRCEGHDNVALSPAEATALPLGDASVDAALSVQALEYVQDTAGALAELHRTVKPGGRVVVWDIDWATLSWHSADPARMERVLEAWDAHLAHPSLPRTLGTSLRAAGFEDVGVEGHVFSSTALDGESFGANVMSVIRDYVAGREAIGVEETRQWASEQRALAERGEFFFTITQFCFTATRP